jgi:tRNA-dihydrouridine synthase
MRRETGCDAVMIGRTASSNPWIFRQIDEYLRTGVYRVPPDRERYELMRRYYLMLQQHGESDAVGKMKQFATYFTHGIRNGSKLRSEIYRTHDVAGILSAVDVFFGAELDGDMARECAEVA